MAHMSQLVPTWQPGFQPARRGRSRSHGRREGGLLKPGGWSFVKTGRSEEVEGIMGNVFMEVWRYLHQNSPNDALKWYFKPSNIHQTLHRGNPPPKNNLIRSSTSILEFFWWNIQEIYGLHAIPFSLGFAISKLPPFRRHRRRARRWRPEKQMAETNLGNWWQETFFSWVAPVDFFCSSVHNQPQKPTKISQPTKIMNKNHNAATQRHQNLVLFLCASHRSKAVERTFEEVRSQRREKFMHCFQQVRIYPNRAREKPGVWAKEGSSVFFLGGENLVIFKKTGWRRGELLLDDLNRMLCIYDTEIFLRFNKNFQWYIFQNTSERDIVWVWGSGFDIHLLVNMHTTHPGKLAWQWTKTSDRRCISCHTWWWLTIADLNFLGGVSNMRNILLME